LRRCILYITFITLAGCQPAIKYPPGGYSYPEHLLDRDTNFYLYPIKDLEPRRDSFVDANGYDFYQSAHEPNLSIRPQPVPTFRLTYSVPLGTDYIISLTPEYITIKIRENYSDECANLPDTSRLTSLERMHYRILQYNFPIEPNGRRNPARQHRLDSLGSVYPALHDAKYYSYLYNKANAHKAPCLTFTQRQIKITAAEFDSLVGRINASGFWQMPYHDESGELGMDNPGYLLEANIPDRYKLVRGIPAADSVPPYRQAWQQLVKKAGMDSLVVIAFSNTPDTSIKRPIVVQETELQEVRQELPKHKRRPKH
jgi:hypothetical protein